MKIYIFGANGVLSQVSAHQDAKTIFANDRFVEHVLVMLFLFFCLHDLTRLFNLEVFNLLFLCSDSFQIHELRLQQVQNRQRWLWLPHFIEDL